MKRNKNNEEININAYTNCYVLYCYNVQCLRDSVNMWHESTKGTKVRK